MYLLWIFATRIHILVEQTADSEETAMHTMKYNAVTACIPKAASMMCMSWWWRTANSENNRTKKRIQYENTRVVVEIEPVHSIQSPSFASGWQQRTLFYFYDEQKWTDREKVFAVEISTSHPHNCSTQNTWAKVEFPFFSTLPVVLTIKAPWGRCFLSMWILHRCSNVVENTRLLGCPVGDRH